MAPRLNGALEGLKQLEVDDLQRWKSAVTQGEQLGFAYYFPSLLTYNRRGSAALVCEDEGSICVFRWREVRDGAPRLDLLVAPTPMNTTVLRRCLDRANDHNSDTRARVLKVDAKDAPTLARVPGLQVRKRKSQFLYSPQAFGDLSGRKYRTARRNISRVRKLPDVTVRPYRSEHKDDCLALLRRWQKHHREMRGTLGGVGTSRRVLEMAKLFTAPDLCGEVILIDGRLSGFAFGGEIRVGVGAFIEAKSDFSVQGLSYFQRFSFLSKLTHFELINDGSDVGRLGLAQMKNSLRPVAMHAEYRCSQVGAK